MEPGVIYITSFPLKNVILVPSKYGADLGTLQKG